jgi:hypothetical protein
MTIGSNSSGHFFDKSLNADGVLYADSSGVITSTSVGTATYVLTSNGSGMAPTFQASGVSAFAINVQTFATSGTYTPTAGMAYCVVECVGGGGGGGGAAAGGGNYSAASGGGAGGYSKGLFTAANIGASKSVTIGAAGAGGATGNNNGTSGGTTSLGILISANGGAFSNGAPSNSITQIITAGGAGASAGSGGFLNMGGAGGSFAYILTTSSASPAVGGSGANSFYGLGGESGIPSSGADANGANGSGYGAGGGGGSSYQGSGGAAGGNGTAGLVIITEYIT